MPLTFRPTPHAPNRPASSDSDSNRWCLTVPASHRCLGPAITDTKASNLAIGKQFVHPQLAPMHNEMRGGGRPLRLRRHRCPPCTMPAPSNVAESGFGIGPKPMPVFRAPQTLSTPMCGDVATYVQYLHPNPLTTWRPQPFGHLGFRSLKALLPPGSWASGFLLVVEQKTARLIRNQSVKRQPLRGGQPASPPKAILLPTRPPPSAASPWCLGHPRRWSASGRSPGWLHRRWASSRGPGGAPGPPWSPSGSKNLGTRVIPFSPGNLLPGPS